MAITDKTIHQITILDDGMIQWLKVRIILDHDGITEINRSNWRAALEPGQDLTGIPARVKSICAFIWTPQVIADFQAKKAANQSTLLGVINGS